MAKHANSHENDAEHHLYEICDRRMDDVYKYGICGRPLNKDGTSPRANEQVNYLNRAMRWACFFAKILVTGIAGRLRAEKMEEEYAQNMLRKRERDRLAIPGKRENDAFLAERSAEYGHFGLRDLLARANV